MVNVLVCDDNTTFADLLENILQKYQEIFDIDIYKFYDGNTLLEYCQGNKYEIVFLDIELGEMNGLDIARRLKYINPQSLMVYMSVYDDYYVRMVQAEPFRFIYKNGLSHIELERTIIEVLSASIRRVHSPCKLTVEFNRVKYYIDLYKVKYFYSMGRTIHIYGNDDNFPSYFYMKMDNLQRELLKIDENFCRIGKSYIVNMFYVKVLDNRHILIDDNVISITSKYRKPFWEHYERRYV